MIDLIRNLKFAFRQLWRARSFTVTAILTLALGIGANAVVFSVLNAVVLHPVNVPNAQNLYMVQRFQYPSQSYPDYLDLRDRNRTFESLFTYDIMGPVGVDTGGNPSTAWPYAASGNYFDALGIQPYLGRFFHAADERGMKSAPYVVLSYEYWHSHFDDDAGVVGRSVEINKHPLTIIGVAPPASMGRILPGPPNVHGGNMDNHDLLPGTSLFLPVHVAGALLSVSDGHAAQGNGEVGMSAVETSLKGEIRVILHDDPQRRRRVRQLRRYGRPKGRRQRRPRGRDVLSGGTIKLLFGPRLPGPNSPTRVVRRRRQRN